MKTYSAFIAEDEPLAAKKLQLFLENEGDISPIRIFSDGNALLTALENGNTDILFLDIEMPRLSGIEVLRRIEKRNKPQIIVTSAYEKYALASFDFQVTDYLLKPYTQARLHQAVERAKQSIALHRLKENTNNERKNLTKRSISIRTELHTEVIDISQIIVLESLKDYTCIVTEQKSMKTLNTLSSFEHILPQEVFIRIHRSYIINISKINSYSRKEVTMNNGVIIPIGPKYKDLFIEAVKYISQEH